MTQRVFFNLRCTGIFYNKSGTELQKIFSPLQQVRILHLNGFETFSSKDIKQLRGVFPNLQTLYLDESDLELFGVDKEQLDALHQAFSHVPNVIITPSASSSINTNDKRAMANLTRKYGFKASVASFIDFTAFFIASRPQIKTVDDKNRKLLTSEMDELVESIKSSL
ncbi:hypothetical protein A8135_11260 [Legionella jamestowniensis]|uniref:Uncharacterized protein n=1 Tax=Legionella jamestowniensis TaxID=455 RepID=A0ABX2XXT2_9GAMM|nr:hypothetical protein [Legionella jamestowniensis]OCH98654.1 hypothetical protein A8135_11260 [Legionella jamestowniensis]